MLRLIRRCPEYVAGYREYCRESYDSGVKYFVPVNPASIDDGWFMRTKPWYDAKERGEVDGSPRSFHYWAVDGCRFIGEFQLRTELNEHIMNGIGSVGYAVRVSEWGRGLGTELLRQGLDIAREHGMHKVLLNINNENAASIRICEKLGGRLWDKVEACNRAEGQHHYAKILDIPVRRGMMAALCSMSNGCVRAAHCWGMRAILILPCAAGGAVSA